LLALAPEHGARTIIDLHNIDSRTVADRIGSLPLWQQLRGFRQNRRKAAQAREADVLAARMADQVWVCSQADQALLQALGPVSDIRVIANPIPDETVLSLPIAAPRYEELRFCFIGHLGYFPNIDAIKPIGRKMVPRLAASGRDWSITVAGRNPRDVAHRLCATHGLHLVENPPYLPDLLAAAGYAPIPLRFGGGTRIKVLEAMAAGLVVCATEKAVEDWACKPAGISCPAATPANWRRRSSPSPHDRKRPPRWPAPAGSSCATGIHWWRSNRQSCKPSEA
jgi:glycosyltransferase involved in cell wall biosynthesis